MSSETKKTIALGALLLGLGLTIPLVILFLVLGLPWWIAPILGLLAGLAIVLYRLRSADRFVLAKLGAVPLDPDDAPRFVNLLEGLSLRAGLSEPDMYVVEDAAPNAASVMLNDRTAVVVTRGLIDTLSRIELEGIVAELLVRLKSGDAEAATVGAALLGIPLIDGPLAGLVRPIAAKALAGLVTADRDIQADMAAVALTRYPPGLQSALTRISGVSAQPTGATPGSQHVWLVADATAKSVIPFSPLDWRIEVLTEL